MKKNTKRFSDRVEDYIKYRPTYPDKLMNILEQEIGLNNSKVIADIGSGTGISSYPFVKNGNTVFGVEPNNEMRDAQEAPLKTHTNFSSINGTAEETNITEKSIDIIFSGQAFHWFDKEKSKKEFFRILKDNGNMVLVWNSRSTDSEFQKEYEEILLTNISEYKYANHRNINTKEIQDFFNPKVLQHLIIDNQQSFDLNGLKGRLKSSSYCPKEGNEYEELMAKIEKLFMTFQRQNRVIFNYKTAIYWC